MRVGRAVLEPSLTRETLPLLGPKAELIIPDGLLPFCRDGLEDCESIVVNYSAAWRYDFANNTDIFDWHSIWVFQSEVTFK